MWFLLKIKLKRLILNWEHFVLPEFLVQFFDKKLKNVLVI